MCREWGWGKKELPHKISKSILKRTGSRWRDAKTGHAVYMFLNTVNEEVTVLRETRLRRQVCRWCGSSALCQVLDPRTPSALRWWRWKPWGCEEVQRSLREHRHSSEINNQHVGKRRWRWWRYWGWWWQWWWWCSCNPAGHGAGRVNSGMRRMKLLRAGWGFTIFSFQLVYVSNYWAETSVSTRQIPKQPSTLQHLGFITPQED